MAVQQIGLDCESSKKSLSAKAAHFSNANGVFLSISASLSFSPSPASSEEEQTIISRLRLH